MFQKFVFRPFNAGTFPFQTIDEPQVVSLLILDDEAVSVGDQG